MEGYIKKVDKFLSIADLVSLQMQEEGYNVYLTTPCLCIPDCEIGSNIRTVQNYKINPTVLNLGVSNDNYE
jgi:hypothetical protein